MGRRGRRSDIAVTTEQPKAGFGTDEWKKFEEILDRDLSSKSRDELTRLLDKFAASQYAANKAPLLSEVRLELERIQNKTADLHACFSLENATPDMRAALVNLLSQGYWQHPLDCSAAHFFADNRTDSGVPRQILSPKRGEIPERLIHSTNSVDEFFKSIEAATEHAIKELTGRTTDPRWSGFDRNEPQNILIRDIRAWAKENGIRHSGRRGTGEISRLTRLIRAFLENLPSTCQPAKIYSLTTIARSLQQSSPSEK